jgi:Flp pilus assembly pilin Flp
VKKLLTWRVLWNDSRGQDFIEYALLVGLVALAAGTALPQVTNGFGEIYSRVNSALLTYSH